MRAAVESSSEDETAAAAAEAAAAAGPSSRGGKAAPKRGRGGRKAAAAKRPAPESDDDGDSDSGSNISEYGFSDEEVAEALRRGGAKKKAKTAGAGAGAVEAVPAPLPPPPPAPAIPTCCDEATHAVLEIMIQRGALHALDVARLGCLSRFWRARAGAELRSMAAEYARALPTRPPGARMFAGVHDQPCSVCGELCSNAGSRHPVSGAPLCRMHRVKARPSTVLKQAVARMDVEVMKGQLVSSKAACRHLLLTAADVAALPVYGVRLPPIQPLLMRAWPA
jgi:hypothetical protein